MRLGHDSPGGWGDLLRTTEGGTMVLSSRGPTEVQKLKRGRESITVHETVLYLDDLLAIVQLFKDHCDSVKVTVEDYLLDDPGSEIFQLKDRLNRSEAFRLTILGQDFYSTQELMDLLGESADDPKRAEELRSQKQLKHPALAELRLDGSWGTLDYDADNLRAIGLSTCILRGLPYRKFSRFIRGHAWINVLGAFSPSLLLVLLIRWFGVLKNKPATYFIPVAVGCGLLTSLFPIWLLRDATFFGERRMNSCLCCFPP
jgi:hypothetical protein